MRPDRGERHRWPSRVASRYHWCGPRGKKHSVSPVMTELGPKVKLVSAPREKRLARSLWDLCFPTDWKLDRVNNKRRCVFFPWYFLEVIVSVSSSSRELMPKVTSSGHQARSNSASPPGIFFPLPACDSSAQDQTLQTKVSPRSERGMPHGLTPFLMIKHYWGCTAEQSVFACHFSH